MEYEKIEIDIDSFKNILNMISSANKDDTNLAISILNNANTKVIHLKLLYKNLNPYNRGIFLLIIEHGKFSSILKDHHPNFVIEWCKDCLLETIKKEINIQQDMFELFEFTKKNYKYENS